MPMRAPRICGCGKVVAYGVTCACQITRKNEADRRRQNAHDRGYDSKWRKARETFLQRNPTCVMCGKPATVVDHVKPHKGDQKLFWSTTNWQSLCAHHHNSTKQSQERGRG